MLLISPCVYSHKYSNKALRASYVHFFFVGGNFLSGAVPLAFVCTIFADIYDHLLFRWIQIIRTVLLLEYKSLAPVLILSPLNSFFSECIVYGSSGRTTSSKPFYRGMQWASKSNCARIGGIVSNRDFWTTNKSNLLAWSPSVFGNFNKKPKMYSCHYLRH